MVCVNSRKEIQSCFVAVWSFVATSENFREKFIIISGRCGLSNDPCQVQDLIGTTPKPKSEAFAASAGEAEPQTEVFDSPMFPLTGQHTEYRTTELQNQRITDSITEWLGL